ncbi:S9 family peptidase [Dongia rigui]|uniref:Prolyl oligopeptidase family serine peptidase n=1 Tax=Dongia rigui TaxID=940149 RepID=A0ABU5DXB6_9PROT|nr:prolyl oligopeptidase family serine peptidase [Dongia rigui]MDY0871216.1 prolyl oligopeptidase family serine peptidase [Dongia rigui]
MTSRFADLAALWSRYPIIGSPHVSADGNWLAWSWTGLADTANVWIVPTDGSAAPRQLTDGTDHFNVNGIASDGSRLIVAQSRGSNEHDRLFLLTRESGELQPLTPEQSDHYVFGGSFHPDGRSILYTADVDYASGKTTAGSWLYVQDLATGTRRVIARALSMVERAPEISHDGRRVLYHRGDLHPAGTQVWMAHWDGSDDRLLFSAGDRFRAYGHWLDDARLLIQAETETHARIGVLDLERGDIRWLVDDPARNIENVVVGHGGHQAMLCEVNAARLMPRLLDFESGRETPLPQMGVSLLPLQQHPGGDWIFEAYRSTAPHAFWRIGPAGSNVQSLAVSAAEGAPRDFAAAQDFRWASRDGIPVQGWLYEPAGASRGLVVWVHGGPTWHSEDWVNPVVQFLVAAGFTVLDPNYRGSTGFGIPFREAIKQDGWGGREQEDIRAGIEALIAAGKARTGRIGVAGLSYGGYSSWVAITRFSDLVDAACAICGMYELGIDYRNTEMPHGRAYSEEMMGGTPEEFPERYFNASPRNFVDRIKGRLMIVHGLADSNVSPANTDMAVKDLDARGIPYRLLTFPDEGHGIYKAGNRARWLTEMADFFADAFGP